MLSVEYYFLDDDNNLWIHIHCNGRRQWRTVFAHNKEHPIYQEVLLLDSEPKERILDKIGEYCREHGFEKRMAELPRIEDTSLPMQLAWEGADESDERYTNIGYCCTKEEEFRADYGMTVAEFKRQLQADIDKYGISSIKAAPEDEEFLYFVDWWIVEHFTGPIKE